MPQAPATTARFESIVEQHQTMVFRALARLMGPRVAQERLEDLAQTVFLRLLRALPHFRGDAQITTYLYRIAVNVAQDEWKRREREDRRHVSLSTEEEAWEDRLPHPADDALTHMQAEEFAAHVNDQLDRLSAPERSVLVLFHQEEQTYEQIAETLGLPINTVRTHLHRGRRRLREALQRTSAVSAPASVTPASKGTRR